MAAKNGYWWQQDWATSNTTASSDCWQQNYAGTSSPGSPRLSGAHWGVPDDPPSEKSKGCRDFGDGVRSGEGLGTLRRLPKAPISLVGHFEGGSSGGKMAKNGQKDNF